MGIFNKEIDKDTRILRELKNTIKKTELISTDSKNYLYNYIDNIENKKQKNDFYDIEFLSYIILDLIDENCYNKYVLENLLNDEIKAVKEIIPFGDNTDNYKLLKEMFINKFSGPDGYIRKGIYNQRFMSLFDNLNDYIKIMDAINSDDFPKRNFNYIREYAYTIIKYSPSYEIFKNDLISYIANIENNIDNVDTYTKEHIEMAKERIGVYSLKQSDIARIKRTANKIESFKEEFEGHKKEVKEEQTNINRIIKDGITEIDNVKKDSIKELKELYEKEREILLIKLDEYLQRLSDNLQEKSNEAFTKILSKYQVQLREFRSLAREISSEGTRSLLSLKEETEKSIEELREYVKSSPELEKYIKEAEKSNQIKDKLMTIISKEEEIINKENEQSIIKGKIIKGIDKEVISTSPEITLPKSVIDIGNITIIDNFKKAKTSIEFNDRMKKIKDIMQLKESEGEIYHEKTEEVIRAILLGEWPYLYGPSGAGKGKIVSQIGELIGINTINGGKIGEPYTILGYIDPQGRFRVTPTFIAFTQGNLIFYDEMDNGNPDTQILLNTLYSELREKINDPTSSHYITYAEEYPIEINPNTRMISAGNTDGSGENEAFNARSQIDEAIQERYIPIYIPYDNKVEQKIFGNLTSWYNFLINFRKVCEDYAKKNGLSVATGNATTRDAADIKKIIDLNAKPILELIDQRFVQIKDNDYRDFLKREIAKIYDIDYSKNYSIPLNKQLSDFKEQEIAKAFIKRCKRGVR